MHLRIRRIAIENLKEDDYNVVLAKSGAPTLPNKTGRPMKMEPGVLEYWDGLSWWPVKIVEEDNDKSPYAP